MADARRTPDFNVDKHDIELFTKEEQLRIYEKIFLSRAFDQKLVDAVANGRIIAPVYLALGQEAVGAALSETVRDYQIFPHHRVDDLYLSLGCSPVELRDELMGLDGGVSGGRAGSSCLRYMKDGIRFFGHHGLIGENIPQAVGAAIATGDRTVCTFGDGGGEEDYSLESFGYAVTRNLPVLFVCYDNDLSILTHTDVRRTWDLATVAEGFGMKAYDISDSPWTLLKILRSWDEKSPLLINCRVCRERWHSGIGIDGEREWKRDEIVRRELIDLGYEDDVVRIENRISAEMKELWA